MSSVFLIFSSVRLAHRINPHTRSGMRNLSAPNSRTSRGVLLASYHVASQLEHAGQQEANKAKPATFIYGRKLAKLYEDCALGSEALPGSSGHIPLLLYDAGSWMGMALVRRPRVVDTYPCHCNTALHFPATTKMSNPPDRRSDQGSS